MQLLATPAGPSRHSLVHGGKVDMNRKECVARNKVTNLALTYTNEVFLGQNLRAQLFSPYGAEATPLDTFQFAAVSRISRRPCITSASPID